MTVGRTMARKLVVLIGVLILALTSCGGSDSGSANSASDAPPVSVSPPDAGHGEELFGVCAACHGADATGIDGLGKDLTNSTFVDGLTDVELVEFIIEGRPADHELNTTGVDMLPRGGNSSFSDQDLFDIVAYMRTL